MSRHNGRGRGTHDRLRVLFLITSSGVGGAEKILYNVITRLDREDFDPSLCSLRALGDTARRVESEGIAAVSLELGQRVRVTELVGATRSLARLIDDQGVDLVHSFLYRANVLARFAARLCRRRPIVVTGHHSLTPPPSGKVATWTERMTHAMSDRCLAVSGAVAERLVRDDGAEASRVAVIANGVDTAHFAPMARGDLRERLGLSAAQIVLGGAGRMSAVKGFDRLIEALAATRAAGVDAKLVLAGDGDERARLEAIARSRAVSEHVLFLGTLPDLRDFYSALDIYVLSSLQEASPTVVLEAMAAGKPVVATPCGGAQGMVRDGETGLFVASATSEALARAIMSLAHDSSLRADMGREARAHAVKNFDVDVMANRHAELYRELLAGRRNERNDAEHSRA